MEDIALVMIIKNEAHIIERCLRSTNVKKWVLADNGSTDDTRTVVESLATELGVEMFWYDCEWKNFGYNRTEALSLARKHCQWALISDADDFFEGKIEVLDNEVQGYSCKVKHGNISYHRPHILNLNYNWCYKGAVHEYAHCEHSSDLQSSSLIVNHRSEGHRSKDPSRFHNDALLLKAELDSDDCDRCRTTFYLAQSYRDAGAPLEALKYYKLREELEGWSEERYISCLNIIRNTSDMSEKIKYGWRAQKYNHQRREAVYDIMVSARNNNCFSEEVYAMGYVYKSGVPDDTKCLFLEEITWRYWDELGLCAFYTNRKAQALQFFELARSLCNGLDVERLDRNINLSKQ